MDESHQTFAPRRLQVIGLGRETKHMSLQVPVHWNFVLPAAHRMQVEMPWLPPIQDRPDDVRCQPRHPQHLADPSDLQLELARELAGICQLARVDHPLPVKGLAQGADQGQVKRCRRLQGTGAHRRHDQPATMPSPSRHWRPPAARSTGYDAGA